jgi:NAD+ diphosphatase
VPTEVTLPYNGLSLDRAGGLRSDPDWVDRAGAHADARTVLLWRDACLVAGDRPVLRHPSEVDAGTRVLLGRDGEAGVFATDLSDVEETAAIAAAGASAVADIRRLFPDLTAQEAATLSYAKGLLHWHRNQRFCGACGGRTDSRDAGHLRVCTGCDKLLFPRIEPAVIVLVEAPGPPPRCLLARHRGAAEGSFSTLAGFVEIGECLEDAVRRELLEEAGVRVSSVRYQASQSWPFPAGLMVGFRATATSDAVAVDRDELAEARWFTRDEVVARLAAGQRRVDSIEDFLVGSWVRETGT